MQRELVILSSSPVTSGARERPLSTIRVSSSPVLPSPGNILPAPLPQGLRSGSHATVIPETATFGFQSALSLLPSDLDVDGHNAIETQKKTVQKAIGKSTYGRTRKKRTSVEDVVAQDTPEQQAKGVGEPTRKKRGRPKKTDVAAHTSRKARSKKVTAKASALLDEKENRNQESASIDLTGDAPLRPKKTWTPPRTTNSTEESFGTFTSKLSEFVHIDAEPKVQPSNADNALLKRKRLELIDGQHAPPLAKEPLVARGKSPKRQSPVKKLKTVTAIAMERYDPKILEPKDIVPELHDSATGQGATDKKRKGKAASGRKQKLPVPKLLSPASAALRCERQDVLFGTSSQLVGPEAYVYLQNLQQALIESEKSRPMNTLKSKRFRSAATPASGSMWNAGAIHSDDAVLEMSKIDEWRKIDDLDEAAKTDLKTHEINAIHHAETALDLPREGEWHDIDEVVEEPKLLLDSVNKESELQSLSHFQTQLSPTKRQRGRPRKNSTLSTKVTAEGVKDISKPKPKISKAKFVPVSQITLDGFVDIDDIQDSEPELTPSPPRPMRAATSPLPLISTSQVVTSKGARATRYGSRADWDTIKDALFTQIKDAVLDAPRSEDPGYPSWHEKILMYEPIVLEDFAAWLNERGLVITGPERDKNDPVLPWMVQKWCEEKSVCCLWKLNNRNATRRM